MSRPNNDFYQPVPGLEVPRFAGVASFMRLPQVKLEDADEVDIGLIGVPWDGGTTNRPGPRHGPRQRQSRGQRCDTLVYTAVLEYSALREGIIKN